MIIMTILSLLLSNAVTLRRDISILFNRIVIIALIYCILHDTMSLSIISKGVGLHGGLLHITNITQVFQILIFLISILILQLTSFNPIIILVFLLIAALLAEAIIFLLEVNPLMLICLTFIFALRLHREFELEKKNSGHQPHDLFNKNLFCPSPPSRPS